MFWNKKDEPCPLGEPLGNLMMMLQPTSIKDDLRIRGFLAHAAPAATTRLFRK